ncbi:MAG: FkbM family methyltransferase [Pseudomonadota bacterium]
MIKKIFKYLGLDIQRANRTLDNESSLKGAFKRIQDQNINFSTIIDIGASTGSWSIKAYDFFPKAKYFLVEAQNSHEKHLKKNKKNFGFEYEITAAGDYEGNIYFDTTSLLGGRAYKEKPDLTKTVSVPINTIDNLINKNNLKPPFLIKLDTHGFEVPILDGCNNALEQTEILIIEVYNFHLSEGALRFNEMIGYLEKKGFHVWDVIDVMRRPGDNVLWQMDMLFARSDRKEFSKNTFE